MATRKEYIYDIIRLLTKAGITDESRLDKDHIGFLVDQRRAKEIRDTYKRNPVIETIWLQDYGITEFTPVNKAEDKAVSAINCKFSKAIIPPVVSINDPMSNTPDLGTYSIRSASGEHEFHYMNVQRMQYLHPDGIAIMFRYFTKIGNALYLTPEVKHARPLLILDSPLDGYVLDNSYINSGNLIVGVQYEVVSGNIIHNGTKYYKGGTQVFTAVNTTFTGTGKVQLVNQKRRMTNDDPYPMSYTMWEVVKMKILTQDFGIEQRVVADVTNDSQDQAKQQ